MADGPVVGGSADDVDETPSARGLPEPVLLERLLPYLHEAVAVVEQDGTIVADLSPPGGLLRRGWAFGQDPIAHLHPEDADRLREFRRAGARSAPGWVGSVEVRLQRGDGSWGLFRIEAHNRFDDPVVAGMVLSTREVTLSASAGAVDVAGTIAMETLADHLPVGLVLLDARGDPVFVNQAASQLLATDVSKLTEGLLAESIAPDDWEEIVAAIRRLRVEPGRETFQCATTGDEPRLLEATFVSRAGPGTAGAVQFVIVTIEDVTHRLARERQLEHRANHDSLTGLPNRAWLLDHLHEQLARGDDLLVAFVDLDGFKAVNDRLGHAAGDDVLAAVAAGLAGCLRAGEAVARVGGDEFVVVAPADGPGAADELRGRIRRAVGAVSAAQHEPLGVSIGTARPVGGDQPWDLLSRADAAMYGEKRGVEGSC